MFVLQSNVFLLLCPIGGNDKMFPLSIKMKWKESVSPSRRFRICFIVLPYERIRSIKYPVKRKSYNRRNESELKKFFTGHITYFKKLTLKITFKYRRKCTENSMDHGPCYGVQRYLPD